MSRDGSQFRLLAFRAFLSILFASPLAAIAEEVAHTANSGSSVESTAKSAIQFRRVFVPAEKMEAWPREGEKLMPIESHDFDALVESANRAVLAEKNPVTIAAAEYSARMENDGELRGTGRWTIVARSDKPSFLPLGNLSLNLRKPRWQGPPEQPARVGIWGESNSSPNHLGLEVDRSGTLEFEWRTSTHSSDDQIEIPWIVPPSNSSRLILDLPPGKQPRIEGAVVLESKQQASDDTTTLRPLRRWVLALNPAQPSTLRIVSADRNPSLPGAKTVLHEDVKYEIGQRGLEMTATWQLEGPSDQKRELTVAVPVGLQLSSIKSDGRDSDGVTRDSSSTTDTAFIDVPKSDGARPLQIKFSAWQPLVVGGSWRLPRLRPEGVYWSSGNFDLSVAASHDLVRLNPSDCIESGSSQLASGNDSPERHAFIAYSPSSAVEIELSGRQPDAAIRSGSSLTLADPNLNGRLVTQWNVSHGATHRLAGKLAPGWIVEAIETVPADAMTDWFINGQGNDQRLEIQLSRAAVAGRNVTVIVTARFQRFNPAEPILVDTMKIVNWEDARPVQHLLAFQSNEPYTTVPIGKLPEIAAGAIEARDRQLLDQTSENKIYDISKTDKDAGLQLTVRRGKFTAEINLDVSYEGESLREDYLLSVVPTSDAIDRLLVFATVPLGDDTRWTDKSTNVPIAAEKLAPNDPQRASLPKDGEVWSLRFAQSSARPIEITASITNKHPDRTPVPLLYVPEATQQSAQIVAKSRNQRTLWLEPVHLQAIPLPASHSVSQVPTDAPPIIAAYRYQPADCRDPALRPMLSVGATSGNKAAAIVARHVQVESFAWPDGSGSHRATYELDGHGATELGLFMPRGAKLVTASLDGNSLDVPKPAANEPVLIRLTGQSRSTSLSLYVETHDEPLSAGRELVPPPLFNDVSYVAGEWTVWLPEEFAAAGVGVSDSPPNFNWRERLFGVFGRPSGVRPFNPFQLADGAALVNGLADGNLTGASSTVSPNQPQPNRIDPTGSALVNPAVSKVAPISGWRSYHESFVASGPSPITILHPPAITAWAIALLLASIICGRWVRRIRREYFVVALAVAAAVALLLPFAYANLASGVVVGLLLSLVIDWPRFSFSINEPPHQPRPNSALTVATAVFFAVVLAWLSHAQAEQNTNSAHTAPPHKLYRVLIPTDGESRPVGTKYYVSDELLRALTAPAANSNRNQNEWLLTDATFSGELIEKPEQKDVAAGNWTLTFSIETLSRDTTVVLPLAQSEADWNATAMLDGVPLPIEWHEAGHKCAIEIPEPGRYSLALACVPKTSVSEGRSQIDLTVPQTSGARLDIRHPESATKIDVAKATVLPVPMDSPNALAAELDRTNRLHIQWSPTGKSENGASGFSLTELRLLHVKPDDLEITIKYILEGGARRPDSIAVTFDNAWKLLTSEKSLNAKISSGGSTSQQVIRFPVPIQSTDRQEFSLRWKLAGLLSLGNLRLPTIELTSVQPTKRWLAMSNDATLDCEVPDASATEATVNEFLAKWGDTGTNDPPQWVISNFDPLRASNLSIRPRETEQIVEESVNVAAGRTTLRTNYEATITPGLAGAYRAELSVPDSLAVDSVTVMEDNRLIPTRWSRPTKNRVNVFFGERLTKPYRLVLEGSTPIDPAGTASLPHISTAATEEATQKTRVYRDDDVRVDLEGLPTPTDTKADLPGPPPPDWSVRPVTICYLEAESAAARVVVKPAKLKLLGDSLTTITRENGGWWANFRCQLTVDEGNLDILRLKFPSTCAGPFDVQSALPVTTEFNSVEDNTGLLAIRFATSVTKGNGADVRIRSPLKPTTDTAISVPAITLEPLPTGHRYIGVPDSADSQTINWAETGVRPATLPAKLRPTSAAATTRYVEVVSDPFQVASGAPTSPEVTPQIRLADTAVVANELGSQRITTRLILAPNRLTECTLQLPPDQSLISIELDGRPAVARQLDPSHWQIALGSPQLPQSLEIISRSATENGPETSNDLQRPSLLAHGQPIPAEMSLWSFAHPQKAMLRQVTGADETTAVEQAAVRFDRLVSIAEAAKSTAAELPPPDGFNWFQPWAKLLAAARAQTQQTTATPQIAPVESQVSHTSEDQIAQATTRMDKWLTDCRKNLVGSEPDKATAPAPATATADATPAPATDDWTYYVAEGGNDRLSLEIRPLTLTPAQIRAIGLAMIVVGLVAAIWLLRRPEVTDILYPCPQALGVLLGIVWWAWMWPSWLGIVIAAISLWLTFRFPWPGRSLRTEASTVLRASRTS